MPDENKRNIKLVFDVMPDGEPQEASIQQTAAKQNSKTPPEHKEQNVGKLPVPMGQENVPHKPHRAFSVKLIIIIVVIVILGVGGYFGYSWYADNYLNKQEEALTIPPTQPTLSEAFMMKYFESTVCEDQSMCSANADPDRDGLSNIREDDLGTNPLSADSDRDGIADNDELRIYETDPILADSDGDGFEDGVEIKNSFSPKVASDTKASSIELQIVQENIAKYSLHELTTAFLSLTSTTTNFGEADDFAAGKLAIGLPAGWTLDTQSQNPLIYNGPSASSTLVLGRSIVEATSTTESLVVAAVAVSQGQYESLTEVSGEMYNLKQVEAFKKSFTFVDSGRSYRMDVVFLRSAETMLTAAIIAPDTTWATLQPTADAVLTSMRVVR